MSKWDDFEVSVPYQCRVGNPPTWVKSFGVV